MRRVISTGTALHYGRLHGPVFTDICVATESPGGFEREQMREQLGGFLGRFSMGRLRRFLSGIVYGNPFRAGERPITLYLVNLVPR